MKNIPRLIPIWCGFLLLIVAPLILHGCLSRQPADVRDTMLDSVTEITLGLVWPLEHAKATLLDGARLAVEEINAAGGVQGKPLVLMLFDDQRSVDRAMNIAQTLVNTPHVSAVIAHLDTSLALASAPTYERNGLLMLSPGAAGMALTSNRYQYIFRTMVNIDQSSQQLAQLMYERGHQNVLIYYIDNAFGRDSARFFERHAGPLGMRVLDRRAYAQVGANHRLVMTEWHDFLSFDAIYLAGSLPEGAEIIRQMRQIGITVPVYGGEGLDSASLIELGGEDVEGVVVVSPFDARMPNATARHFASRFQDAYGFAPDASAAGGYDAVHLMAEAITHASSIKPADMAQAMRTIAEWEGATGLHTFAENGDLIDKRAVFKIVRDGRLELL